MKSLNIVIVGHVDHGKSTLIGRFLYDTGSLPKEKIEELEKTSKMLGKELEFAFVMDNLDEEREQGITIDTAHTYFKSKDREYVIIDAPGHKEFLKNMITGASQAEAAILLVDADEGIQEQTKRHAYILHLLGIKQVTVAVNKMDLINYDEAKFNTIKSDLLNFLKEINLNPEFIIPISSKAGDNIVNKSSNMSWYDDKTIIESLDTFKNIKDNVEGNFRLPVQDIYKIDDKRYYVGKISSGTLKKDDELVFLPSNAESKIKSIELYPKDLDQAEVGMSIGLTLNEQLFLERGYIACIKNQDVPKVTSEVVGNFFWISKNNIKKGDTITLKCSTQEVEAKIESITDKINSSTLEKLENTEELNTTEVAKIKLTTKKPIIVEDINVTPELGRFVLSRDMDIVGGGILVN